MLVTSKDLLMVALAFAILWTGVAIGFGCFYLAMILRDFWYITKVIRRKVEAVEKVVTAFKSKVENTASFVPPLIEGVSKIIEAIAEKKKTEAAKESKKSRKK
jgi:Na+-transporting methylmalonyl-CoA/oxaloacetate decarboxylase gamma subunit